MSGVVATSLDYTAAEAGLRLAGITSSPALWSDIREIERGAQRGMLEALK